MDRGHLVRWTLFAAVVAGFAWLALRPAAVKVDTVRVDIGAVLDQLEAEGRTRLSDRYVITAPLAAQARRLALDAGDAVGVGDVLVVLDPLPAPALDPRARAQAVAASEAAANRVRAAGEDLAAAEAAAGQARRESERLGQLAAQALVARDVAERAATLALRGEREAASARFRLATAQYEQQAAASVLSLGSRAGSEESALELMAPVEGVVLRRYFESSRPVQPGEPLLEIGDPGALEVEVDVLSADAVRLREGMAVELHRWGEALPLQGQVRRIEPAGFTKVSALGVEEQRVWVIVDLTSERGAWQRLGDAYRVNARFLLDRRDEVRRVPGTALFRRGDGWAVFEVASGRAVARSVELGLHGGAWVELLAGLEPGAEVIVHPGRDLEDGQRVSPR